MQPNLSYLSPQGVRLEQIEMPAVLRLNSIRHLAVRPDGLVAFAMQAQSRAGAAVGLLGFHQRGRPAELAVYPRSELVELQGYIGGVAYSTDGTQLALSSRGEAWCITLMPSKDATHAGFQIVMFAELGPALQDFWRLPALAVSP